MRASISARGVGSKRSTAPARPDRRDRRSCRSGCSRAARGRPSSPSAHSTRIDSTTSHMSPQRPPAFIATPAHVPGHADQALEPANPRSRAARTSPGSSPPHQATRRGSAAASGGAMRPVGPLASSAPSSPSPPHPSAGRCAAADPSRSPRPAGPRRRSPRSPRAEHARPMPRVEGCEPRLRAARRDWRARAATRRGRPRASSSYRTDPRAGARRRASSWRRSSRMRSMSPAPRTSNAALRSSRRTQAPSGVGRRDRRRSPRRRAPRAGSRLLCPERLARIDVLAGTVDVGHHDPVRAAPAPRRSRPGNAPCGCADGAERDVQRSPGTRGARPRGSRAPRSGGVRSRARRRRLPPSPRLEAAPHPEKRSSCALAAARPRKGRPPARGGQPDREGHGQGRVLDVERAWDRERRGRRGPARGRAGGNGTVASSPRRSTSNSRPSRQTRHAGASALTAGTSRPTTARPSACTPSRKRANAA